jgi:small nuclear ribonucleoprotein
MVVLPLETLNKIVSRKVSVLLKDGKILEGLLTGVDQYMNLVLENTTEKAPIKEEIINENNEKVIKRGEKERKLGTVVLRGTNILSISPL